MKIKLRDMTEENFREWQNEKCDITDCKECVFSKVWCELSTTYCWVNNKDYYSDKFLDQEIEVEILTESEREYLSAVIKPFRDVITYIVKSEVESVLGNNYNFITIKMRGGDSIILPMFPTGKYYKNMEAYKDYTLKELEIYDND